MTYLIKYAEIALKGDNRKLFEEALVRQIRRAMAKLFTGRDRSEGYEVIRARGRIYVEVHSGRPDMAAGHAAAAAGSSDESGSDGSDSVRRAALAEAAEAAVRPDPEVIEALSRVFGITAICPALELADEGFERLAETALIYMEKLCPAQAKERPAKAAFPVPAGTEGNAMTFKVLARRGRKNYPMNSMEIAAELGGRILDAFPGLRVDVHQPEIELHVEIREKIFVYGKTIPGPGGMPSGTAGRGMLLLSGGIDSPVAGYMAAKRGVSLEAVYFHAPPYTSERAKRKVVDLAERLSLYAGKLRLHVINFTEIQMAIYEKCPHEELTVIMRRYMMRIAESLALEGECQGLFTGESIGQVASQTMGSLVCTNAVCTLPVFRPLIGFDKQEIIRVAERIGTYETSILPFEDCCTIFVAKHPVTKPKLHIIEKHEKNLEEVIDGMLKKALEEREILEIS